MAQQETLIIKHFGPLREAVIEDVKQFMFFIGESGSGKSTLLKVLALMRHISKQLNLRSYLKHGNVIDRTIGINMGEYLYNGGLNDYVSDKTELYYKKGDCEISYTTKGLKGTRKTISAPQLSLEKISFLSDKRGSIASLLANNNDGTALGFYLAETFKDFKEAIEQIKNIEMPFLNVRYYEKKMPNGARQFYIGNMEDTYGIHFEDASSGIQTVTPLAVIAEYYSKYFDIVKESNRSIVDLLGRNDSLASFKHDMNVGDIENRSIHLVIEEPELSLFPKAQRSSINMLVRKSINSRTQMTLAVATHSPYIVNHLNLLLKAKDKGGLVEGAALDYGHTGVYVIENGMLRDIMVQNAHLVNTDYLSDDINDIYNEYDKLDGISQ